MENVVKHETLETLQYFFMAPGICAQDVVVNADREESVLYIEAKESSTASKELLDLVNLSIRHKLQVDAKYDVASTQVKVENGIVTVTLSVQKDRVVKVHPKDGK